MEQSSQNAADDDPQLLRKLATQLHTLRDGATNLITNPAAHAALVAQGREIHERRCQIHTRAAGEVDANVVSTFAQIVDTRFQYLFVDRLVSLDDVVKAFKQQFGRTMVDGADHRSRVVFDLKGLGSKTAKYFARTPRCDSLSIHLMPLLQEAITDAPAQRKKRGPRPIVSLAENVINNATQVDPSGQHKEFERRLTGLHTHVRAHTQAHDLDVADACVFPKSFGKTVEEFFHLAVLLREGRLKQLDVNSGGKDGGGNKGKDGSDEVDDEEASADSDDEDDEEDDGSSQSNSKKSKSKNKTGGNKRRRSQIPTAKDDGPSVLETGELPRLECGPGAGKHNIQDSDFMQNIVHLDYNGWKILNEYLKSSSKTGRDDSGPTLASSSSSSQKP